MDYKRSAEIYEAIYVDGIGKDYAAEARAVHDIIQWRAPGKAHTLLDVACGTGGHMEHFATWYDLMGVDYSEPMLAVARRRFPEFEFLHGDMCAFTIDRRFDAVVCLFSAIGHTRTTEGLNAAIATMRRHLKPGGVLIVEPWWAPHEWRIDQGTWANFIDRRGLKIARMNFSERDGNLSSMLYHFLVGTHDSIEYFTELHEMGLFARAEYEHAYHAAGLQTEFDERGLIGRGLYVGDAPK